MLFIKYNNHPQYICIKTIINPFTYSFKLLFNLVHQIYPTKSENHSQCHPQIIIPQCKIDAVVVHAWAQLNMLMVPKSDQLLHCIFDTNIRFVCP